MTPSVSNATESEKEEGSAWREGLVILGDRCRIVIEIIWRMIITMVKMIMMVLMTTMVLIMMVVLMTQHFL